ncbi:RING-box protein 1A-like [Drosophila miranda]|uniref:RING-box protein 1A-like n=1 Tax=Drosophila miranda TaxID=7229 RepID=UPI00143F8763|nr:RING-box protein 1A-like [Drosophila miranda]
MEVVEGVPMNSTMPRFVVKKWNAMATWRWDVDVEICAICRNKTYNVCIECQASEEEIEPEQCNVVTGVCQHVYHYHCISRWLRERQVCPLDNKKWDYLQYGR